MWSERSAYSGTGNVSLRSQPRKQGESRRAYLHCGLRCAGEMLVPTGCVPDGRGGFVLDLLEVPLFLGLENLIGHS